MENSHNKKNTSIYKPFLGQRGRATRNNQQRQHSPSSLTASLKK